MTAVTDKNGQIERHVFDRAEQIVVLLLYAALADRLWPDQTSWLTISYLLILLSEGAPILFMIIRRPARELSLRPADWAVAAAGTYLPLMIAKGGPAISLEFGVILLVLGMLVHIGAKLSLNLSFGLVAANRGVKTNGLYRIVRHPMYAGYMICHLGFLLTQPSVYNLGVYLLTWTFLGLRIAAEERVLLQDEKYREMATRVRYRLIPGVY